MLTKMKIALALGGSLLVGGVGLAAAHPFGQGKAEVIQKYDTNGDGKLDDQEKAALRADMKAKHEARRAEMLAKYDTNKDGKLDDQERAVMRAERAEEVFKKLDTDGNGQISLQEFKAGQQSFARHHGGGMRHHGFGKGQP